MINLLLVTHRFHPYDKVGARRWSKFVNYLQCYEDLRVTVITQQSETLPNNTNPWNIDLKPSVKVIRLRRSLPAYLSEQMKIGKWLFNVIEHKWRRVRGYTDEGYGFSQRACDYISRHMGDLKPDVIIASVPAFSTAYFMARLKQKYPEKALILDFRDVWTDGFLSWNPQLTTQSPFYLKQVEMERFSLEHCDALVSVTPEAVEKIGAKFPDTKRIQRLFTNGCDRADLNKQEPPYPSVFNTDKINICHFGTLDFGRDLEFIKLVGEIQTNQIEWYCFGYFNASTRQLAEQFPNVHLAGHLPHSALHPYFFHADYHLIINDREFYYAYGSKIFDAILYNKKVIYISRYNSLVDKFKNRSGFCYSENDTLSNKALLDELTKTPMAVDEKMLSEFDVEVISAAYYELIKEVYARKH